MIRKVIWILLFPSFAFATTKLDQILDKMDRLYRSEHSISKMTMSIRTPYWERTLRLKAWTKGLEKTFILIEYPRKDKGTATLKKGSEMWNYFPKINKVIKVPPSMMMGAWMGSDFTNDDLVKENTWRNDYINKIIKETEKEYVLESIPKKDTVTVWAKIVLTVEKARLLPLRFDYYDEKGKKVREMLYSKIEKMGERIVPLKMTLNPLTKKGHQTVIEYNSLDFKTVVKESFFSKRNLEKQR